MDTAKQDSLTDRPQAEEGGDPPLLVGVPNAAHLLGIGLTFTWELVRRGELPSIKLGRRVLIPRTALEHLAGRYASENQ